MEKRQIIRTENIVPEVITVTRKETQRTYKKLEKEKYMAFRYLRRERHYYKNGYVIIVRTTVQ